MNNYHVIDKSLPGYTDLEKNILVDLLQQAKGFLENPSWQTSLPFLIEKEFILAHTENNVIFSIQLKEGFDYDPIKKDLNLYLKRTVLGTAKDSWPYAEGGFYLSIGSYDKVLTDISNYLHDLSIIQDKLHKGYYSIFNY